MVNTNMFRHPKYYKELRKRNKSDQAISLRTRDGECERTPDSGLKQQASSIKLQASSKPEPSSGSAGFKRQATSIPIRVHKPQASSHKLQAQ